MIRKRYRNLTIRRKFVLFNGLFLLTMLLFFRIVLNEVRRSVEETTIGAERLLLGQTSHTLELVAEEAHTIADSIASQPLLYRMANATDLDAFFESNDTAVYARDFFSEIESVQNADMLSEIHIYLSPDYEHITEVYDFSRVFRPMSEIQSSYWHGIFAGRPLMYAQFCPAFYLTNQEIRAYGDVAYIQRLNLTGQGRNELGFIAIYFQTGFFKEILSGNRPEQGSVYYLINSRESLVASTDEELSGIYHIDYEDIPTQIGEREEYHQRELSGQRMFAAYNNIAGTDWRLISLIPTESIHGKEQGRLIRQFGFLMLLFLGIVILEIIFSRNISSRIITLAGQMTDRAVSPDRALKRLPEQENDDEIGQLVHTYNQLVERITALVESERETADKLKVSEVNALQSQINPHFLYNMLDMINWQARAGHNEAVSRAVQSLSRFYRLVLSGRDILIPIRDELRHVTLYLELQNMRYEDKLHFIIDVPDELSECPIPKLVLQPMVENSILHGILEKEPPVGTIVIMAWEERNPGTGRDDIVMTVSDDGIGLTEEKLCELKEVLNRASRGLYPQESDTDLAVYNTQQRLTLLFGQEYGLTYRHNEPRGTEVEIRIPNLHA
ncbi:MAG: histidine kinase [Lachnospiraceae bacterium]|nr:histidine kinase [Lachnospiraceae bacterium]